MKKELISTICLCLFISGCATTGTNIPKGHLLDERVIMRDYEINKPRTVSTGSVMVEKKEGIKQYKLIVTSAKRALVGQWEFCFGHSVSQAVWYFNSPWHVEDSVHLDLIKSYMKGETEPVIFRITALDFWTNSYPANGEAVPSDELSIEEEIAEVGGMMQQLLYNGKQADGTINITYREFKDNFARPAFYQELSYDLEQSSVISFRDYLIEITEATNNQITFIVKKE